MSTSTQQQAEDKRPALSPLARAVYNALSSEHPPMEAASHYPEFPRDRGLSEFEYDCRDWGIVFGIVFGIARSQDAFESAEDVNERALAAAKEAWAAWDDEDIFTEVAYLKDRAGRNNEPAIDVMREYDKACTAGKFDSIPPDLAEAIERLGRTLGR